MSQNIADKVVFENVDPAVAATPAAETTAAAEQAPSVSNLIATLPRKHTLEQAVTINGKELKELDLDVYRLKGADFRAIDKELRQRFPAEYNSKQLQDSILFRETVVGRLNGFIGDDCGELGGRDYLSVLKKLSVFLAVLD
jgi:hypothetical protein